MKPMDSTANPRRFRFRDHDQEMVDDDQSFDDGHTTADSSSLSTDGDNDHDHPQLQSMTAKGVQHLCSELLELKQESDEDFQLNIFSNYHAFIAIIKDIEVLQSELEGMKNKASLQKKLVKQVSEQISSSIPCEATTEEMLEETPLTEQSSPTIFDKHIDNVSELFDTLLSENRLDDALSLLQTEEEYIQKLWSEEYSSDQIILYKSNISEKRALLADRLLSIAKHPRISAAELQKTLSGLWQLGNTNLANQILFQHYHSKLESGIANMQSSKESPNLLYIKETARFVCSMISQCARSFLALNGEDRLQSSELTQWTKEQIKVLSACFIKYVESISDISGRLSTAVEALQIVMSYCSLLERQGIYLQPLLMEFVRPSMEEVLKLHINHLSNVLTMVTSTDNWNLGRYNVSGIFTGRSSEIVDQQPECFFLTDSGRKFVTLFQSVAEEISPLMEFEMERSVVKGMMEVLAAYIAAVEKTERERFGVNLQSRGVIVLASVSTLMQFVMSSIRDMFDGLDLEIENEAEVVGESYSRLKSSFLGQFVSNIFSPNADHESSPVILISRQDSSRYCDLIPSLPYLELYLELKKLEKLGEDECLDLKWLMGHLRDVMDATFEWMFNNPQHWIITTTDPDDNMPIDRTKFIQFIFDTQFLVEMARRGGYLSENAMNMSKDIISRVEPSFLSSGLTPIRDLSDEEWPASAAILALEKLEELQSLEDDDAGGTDEDEDQVSRTEQSQIDEEGTNGLAE